jgi:dipeptidyl aminopeptidase/acylaminoacyl peptidase
VNRKLSVIYSLLPIIAVVSLNQPAAAQQSGSDAAKAGQGRVATEVFGRRPFMQAPRLSPDGTKIVTQMGRKGVDYLGIVDLSKPGSPPEFFLKAEEFREVGDRTVAGWRWVGNRTVLMTLVSRETFFGDRVDLTRLIAYDLETKKLTPLAWEGTTANGSNILHVDHEKETILLQRGAFRNGERRFKPEVIKVNVRTGDFDTVMQPNPEVDSWIADGNGVIRASVGYERDSGKTRIMYRSGNSGHLETVYNKADPTFTDAESYPEIFLNEPDMALATSNRDGFRKVYKLNMKTMEPVGAPLFEVKGYDVSSLISNLDDDRLVGVGYTSDRFRIKYFDPRMAEIQKILDEDYGTSNATIISANREYTRFIVSIAKPEQRATFYLYDVNTGDFGRLGYADDTLREVALNPVKMIRYSASDGESIEAVLTMPRHRKGQKNLPVVMITHGGPFGPRDDASFDGWAQAIAELGYVVVQPNFRGSGGYGKAWISKGRANGFGLRMQDDLNDAIDHLAREGIVDPKRACMMGWSYGGYASARAAQRDPDRWRCTIAGAGVYDLPEMRAYDVNYLGSFGANYLAKGAAELSEVSPARNADGKWSPIMIVHGERDQRVPVGQARILVRALKSSGKKQGIDFDYLEQPKNTHNLPYDDVHIEWLEAAEKWLAKHNPAYIDSDTDKVVPVALASR